MPLDPHRCRCNVETIDYTDVDYGRLHCTRCDRKWVFTPGKGWSSFPTSQYAPSA